MTVLLSAYAATNMLNAFQCDRVKLHTGNPGPAGLENLAVENAEPGCILTGVTEETAAAGRHNENVIEFKEVKAKETYRFVSFWFTKPGSDFVGYAELAEPKTVEVGNTFKFPIGSIVIHF